MEEINPYATPIDAGSDAGSDLTPGLWQVSGGCLLFRDGARLPGVDLYTGSREVAVTPASSEFRAGLGGWMALMRWGWVVVFFPLMFFVASGKADFPPLLLPGAVLVWIVVSRVFLVRRLERARLHWHVAAETEGKRRRWLGWATRFFWIGLAAMMAGTFGSFRDWMPIGTLFFIVGLVAMVIAQSRTLQLRCMGVRDGWFEIRGIPAAALAVLAGLQEAAMRDWVEGAVRMRKRKVYTVYLYRFSMGVLLGNQIWNPLLFLTIFLMKLGRSRLFIRESFDHSEAEDLKPGEWDPSLRAKWEECQAAGIFDGWRMLHARELDSPPGDILNQWFVLTSPDGTQCLTVALVRAVNARASKEIVETTFRSWSGDGSQWLTSNLRLQKPLPAGYRVRRVSGSLVKRFEVHRRRTGGLELVRETDPEGWESRLLEEVRARQAVLEQAGIVGPVVEKEFRADT